MPLQATSGAASYDAFGGGVPVVRNYIDDVFSTYLYQGNSSTQTITNGIDLAGNGGLVWVKDKVTAPHFLFDTARGGNRSLSTDSTNAQSAINATDFTGFTSSGFNLGFVGNDINNLNRFYASWTFRKQPKFFDVVTYTGTGVARTIAHSLKSTPGCIIVKRTDTTSNWQVYHSGLTNAANSIQLNLSNAQASATTVWNSTAPTSTVFSVGTDATVNASGGTYVAYLFAHNAGGFGLTGTDNVISCGSYTGNGSTNGPEINLGYEPQWLLVKEASGSSAAFIGWYMFDNMRGFTASGSNDAVLRANESAAEDSGADYFAVQSTGFKCVTTNALANESGGTYIYIAIRRGPMKVPTSGTSVFQPTVYTGTNVDNRLVNTTIPPDMVFVRQRNDTVLGGMVVGDRLRAQPYLLTGTTAAEVNDADAFDQQLISSVECGSAFSSMNGFWCGNDPTAKLNINTTGNNHIAEAFRRAPGFFDVVCYTGTGSARTVSHNLGVKPEFIVGKRRDSTSNWEVYAEPVGATSYFRLNNNMAPALNSSIWNDTEPTSSVFTVGATSTINLLGSTYVAYLFASCPGVSKVGSYTGTGTTKQVDCGFTGGARFVLIKRTDSTGDWYVWDSARGIVAGNDPYLLLNSTAAEVTNTDYVDTYSAGFEISSTAPAAINASGGTFIFLAIA